MRQCMRVRAGARACVSCNDFLVFSFFVFLLLFFQDGAQANSCYNLHFNKHLSILLFGRNCIIEFVLCVHFLTRQHEL